MFNWCEWGMSFFALMNFEQGLEGYFESQHLWFDQWENARYVNEKQDLKATWEEVYYTAVFSVVTQRSSPLTAAENRTTFLSLCVCGLTNKPIMALGSEHASQFSTNQSIVAEFRRALCFQATKRLICKKSLF